MKIVIIDYDAGNVKSLQFALERLGIEAQITHDTELVSAADKVIFPGQGEASSAMEKLKSKALDVLIPQLKQPVLVSVWGCNCCVKKPRRGIPSSGHTPRNRQTISQYCKSTTNGMESGTTSIGGHI